MYPMNTPILIARKTKHSEEIAIARCIYNGWSFETNTQIKDWKVENTDDVWDYPPTHWAPLPTIEN